MTNNESLIRLTELMRVGDEPGLVSEILVQTDRALMSFAVLLFEKKEYAFCSRFLELCLAKKVRIPQPDCVGFLVLLADSLYEQKRYGDSLSVYDQILAVRTSDATHANKALALWEMKNFAGAEAEYSKAVSINPNNKIAQRGLGEMRIRLDRPGEAVPALKMAVELDPHYGAAFRALGIAYYNEGEWHLAYKALVRALEIDPSDGLALMGKKKLDEWFNSTD